MFSLHLNADAHEAEKVCENLLPHNSFVFLAFALTAYITYRNLS